MAVKSKHGKAMREEFKQRMADTKNDNMMYGYYFDNPPTRSSAKRTLGYSVPQIPHAPKEKIISQTLNGRSQRFTLGPLDPTKNPGSAENSYTLLLEGDYYELPRTLDASNLDVLDYHRIGSLDVGEISIPSEYQMDSINYKKTNYTDHQKFKKGMPIEYSKEQVAQRKGTHDELNKRLRKSIKHAGDQSYNNELFSYSVDAQRYIRSAQKSTNRIKRPQNVIDSKKAAQETAEKAMKESDKLFSKLGKYSKVALGFGATAWLVNKLSDTRGQQTNAQLYGQQQYY
jgi:hypothetical protein